MIIINVIKKKYLSNFVTQGPKVIFIASVTHLQEISHNSKVLYFKEVTKEDKHSFF